MTLITDKISYCPNCNAITKSVLAIDGTICGKCKKLKVYPAMYEVWDKYFEDE